MDENVKRHSRRALSPLIATAILISAAVVGGMMLYNYFNTAMGSVNNVDSLLADFRAMNTGSSTVLYYEFWNTGTQPVTVKKIVIIDDAGNRMNETMPAPVMVRGGEKISGTLILDSPLGMGATYIVYAEYSVRGKTATTNPVQLTVTP